MKELRLSNGGPALVDDEDYDRCAAHTWNLHHGYARCSKLKIKLHQFILNVRGRASPVDHANRDPLDNRKKNLRLCTHAQNCANAKKSKGAKGTFKGVAPTPRGTWTAQVGGKPKTYLGVFQTQEEAARAYDIAARERYGEFASLNFGTADFPTPNRKTRTGYGQCKICGARFHYKVASRIYCSQRCNKRAFDKRHSNG